eukprot:CAMPEP_0196598892 /NCGR_PEP_ID=MMETSP1081-20130531/94567_1 /TAXON_ID=36882 /ORGANISM="Pyramimonas amylifera, Strain CCMP720" /LENGTH=155 /DNA_ID=CAMNT_0041924627 /DNA_START=581 /DNA_END=1048 /DNA_ORIENTATION=-
MEFDAGGEINGKELEVRAVRATITSTTSTSSERPLEFTAGLPVRIRFSAITYHVAAPHMLLLKVHPTGEPASLIRLQGVAHCTTTQCGSAENCIIHADVDIPSPLKLGIIEIGISLVLEVGGQSEHLDVLSNTCLQPENQVVNISLEKFIHVKCR